MKEFYAGVVALMFLAAPAAAGDSVSLPPGHPAGLHKAQDSDNMALYLVGGGAIIAGIVILASDNDSAPVTSAATTTTTSS